MRLMALLRERLFGAEQIARRGRQTGRKFQSRPAIRPRFHRLSLEWLEDRLAPATLTVNSTGDTVSGLTATLDLREAILLVNSGGTATDSSGYSLAAAKSSQISGAFGSNDTIQFDSSLNGQTITLSGIALPSISKSVTITDLGASSLAISGNKKSVVFTIHTGTQVTISGLTIEDGAADLGRGGGISNAGTLTVSNCTVSANSASFGGGIYNAIGGTLTVSNCTVSANSASNGGGIFNDGGTLTVSDCTVSANSGFSGVGLYSEYGTLTVSNCTVSANSTSGGSGGGIYNYGATLKVTNCTVSANSASGAAGGGIYNGGGGTLTVSDCTVSANSAGSGGGICDGPGTLTVSNLSNCTLVNNSASNGGGIDHSYGTLKLTNCTVAYNSATFGGGIHEDSGVGTLNNTLVADSISGGDLDLSGGSFSGAYDLIGDGSQLGNFTNSLQGNPLFAPLGNYGGPTQALALLPGNPAIDAGSNALAVDANGNPLTTDQRGVGFPRIINNTVDIGAFESEGAAQLAFVQQPTNTVAGSSISTVTVAVEDNFGNVEIDDNTDTVTLALGAGSPSGGVLNGTLTETVTNGVATFSDLFIDQAGTGYQLVASSSTDTNLTNATSSSFYINPAGATQLVFTQPPTDTAAGVSISPAVTVAIEDQFGNIETGDSTDSISMTIGTNPSSGTLSGTTTQPVSAGVATFQDLSINNGGNGYTLVASSTVNSTNLSVTSDAFDITSALTGPTNISNAVSITRSGFRYNFALHEFVQTITITNTSSNSLVGPLALQLTNLSTNATLANASGTNVNGDPYIDFLSAGQSLAAGQSITVTLYFKDPTFRTPTYGTQVWQNLS